MYRPIGAAVLVAALVVCPAPTADPAARSEGAPARCGHTGETVRFFHPRHHTWSDHFEWSATRPGELIGRTPTGRATIAGLRINDPDMVALRILLAELTLIPEVTPELL